MQSPTASNGTLRQSTPLIQQTPELAGQEQKEPEQPAPFVSRLAEFNLFFFKFQYYQKISLFKIFYSIFFSKMQLG